ncbi:MAG: sulfite exporter TauE/SafE family protein [Polyangiaceae bacterium]
MTVVVALLSLAIGIVLGMLGGGGSILTLPMLVYVAGVDAKAAIAMSLFVVGSTSVVGAVLHARAGRVRGFVGTAFGVAAMVGAYGGGRVAHAIPSTVLLATFALLMLVTAVAMLRGRPAGGEGTRPPTLHRIALLGLLVGSLSGLVGAGGGFLIVPALVLFGGLAMRDAVGTSLFVIALQSFAGFAGHATHVTLDTNLTAMVTGSSVLGTFLGTFLATKVPTDALRRGFAWLVLAMGLFVLGKEVPAWATATIAVACLSVVAFVLRAKRTSTSLPVAASSSGPTGVRSETPSP